MMSLAFGQCFLKALFVYKEFCDYESGTLHFFWRRLVLIVAFKTLDISQGSVATRLGMVDLSDSIITNFLLILTVK